MTFVSLALFNQKWGLLWRSKTRKVQICMEAGKMFHSLPPPPWNRKFTHTHLPESDCKRRAQPQEVGSARLKCQKAICTKSISRLYNCLWTYWNERAKKTQTVLGDQAWQDETRDLSLQKYAATKGKVHLTKHTHDGTQLNLVWIHFCGGGVFGSTLRRKYSVCPDQIQTGRGGSLNPVQIQTRYLLLRPGKCWIQTLPSTPPPRLNPNHTQGKKIKLCTVCWENFRFHSPALNLHRHTRLVPRAYSCDHTVAHAHIECSVPFKTWKDKQKYQREQQTNPNVLQLVVCYIQSLVKCLILLSFAAHR